MLKKWESLTKKMQEEKKKWESEGKSGGLSDEVRGRQLKQTRKVMKKSSWKRGDEKR